MGLFDAVGQGLSQAGYGAADLLGKQAIIQQQNDAEYERMARLETLKRAMDIARDFTIMNGGGPADALRAMQNVGSGGSVDGGQSAVAAPQGSGMSVAQSSPGTAQAAAPPPGGASQSSGAAPNGLTPNMPANAFTAWSQKYKVPEEILRSAYVGSGMKGVAEILAKRGIPNIEFVGNVAIDKNQVDPGFSVPQVSANGTASQSILDPTAPGGFRVIAPPGALDTASAYAEAAERAKNRQTPLPQTFVNKGTQHPIGGSIDAYLNPPQSASGGQQPNGAIPVGNGVSITPEMRDFLLADAQKNGVANPVADFKPPPGYRTATLGLDHSQGSLGSSAPAPNSGGPIQLQSAAEGKAAEVTASKAAESGQAYQDALNSKVEEEFQLVNRNKQIQPLLSQFTTGGIAPETRLKLGNEILNSSLLPDGMKQTVATWVANGDPTTGKVIQNQLASAGILTMLQTLDKEGKPNRAIFQAVQKAQEGLESGNTTLKDVFELQKRLYDIHYNEQQALTKSIKDGSYDPRTWAGDYAAVRNSGLNEPAAPLPSATTPAKAGSPVQIKGEGDFNALPSGTLFVGPDGIPRRKP